MILPELVALYQTTNELRIEYAALQRPIAQYVLTDYGVIRAPKPLSDRHGKPILGRARIASGKTPFML